MLQVRVPPGVRPALQQLARLKADERSSLREALLSADGFTPLHDLADLVAGAANLSHEEGLEIIHALLSFNVQLGMWDESPSAVAQGVADSQDLELQEGERSALAEILKNLLDADSLSTAAKAADLITEHEHVYNGIRIVTDLRPIFGDDPTENPAGMTLSATVKLDHYTDGRIKSLYISADEEDLRAIRDSVDRALKKSETMRKLIKVNNLPLYRADREEP